MVRVAFVTQWFPPEPAYVPLSIVQSLSASGIDIRVLTGMPNYPEGKIYEGYPRWPGSVDEFDGLTLQRAPLFPNRSSSTLKRTLNYLSFSTTAAAHSKRVLAGADVTLVYGSPATAAIPALYAKRRWGTPFVFMVQDLWPDSVFSTGFLNSGLKGSLASTALNRLMTTIYHEASQIIAISPGMIEELRNRGVPPEKLTLLYNWANEKPPKASTTSRDVRTELGIPEDSLMLLYAGNHGYAQGLDSWIHAMEKNRDSSKAHLVLIGSGPHKKELEELTQTLGVDRVHLLDPVSQENLTPYTLASDAMIISLTDKPLFSITIPGKTQEALFAEKPILASIAGDVSELIRGSNCGFVAEPSNPESIAQCIRKAEKLGRENLSSMGIRSKQLYSELMERQKGAKILNEALTAAQIH
ncbi:MAG: glycosyltransferase family 4 protein [Candidatus Nanopelagicales bacterium]